MLHDMPGPATEADALAWIQGAVKSARYIVDAHFHLRARQRGFSLFDAKAIVATAVACERYAEGTPLASGTCWRLTGTALDGTLAKVGAEAFLDHLGRQVILITIMDA
jgi:hypothetical protein